MNKILLFALLLFPANDNAIAQAMKLARKGITTKPGVTGKIRAKGVDSETIYDVG